MYYYDKKQLEDKNSLDVDLLISDLKTSFDEIESLKDKIIFLEEKNLDLRELCDELETNLNKFNQGY